MNGTLKKIFGWQFFLGIVLILISAVLYYAQYLLFKDVPHLVLYVLNDIAFVPIEVLIVTLIIHKLLNVREKKALLQKMNMLIGAFFSEVGTGLLERFSGFDLGIREIRNDLMMSPQWPDKKFAQVSRQTKALAFKVDSRKGDLGELKLFLVSRRQFMLGLLENPVLLEHDSFTELLWAVFHITEELDNRKNPAKLPETDYDHISGDINRAYKLLVSEWLDYMLHLKKAYPYLFSLAVRTNPFNPEATAEVS